MSPKKFLAGACITVLLGPLAFAGVSVAKESRSVVREAIVTTLGPDGAVEQTQVAQLIRLHSSNGEEVELRVPKTEELDSYRNLSGFRNPSGEGGDYVWSTKGDLDARTLSRYSGALPIAVRVHYFLDGAEMSADEIKHRDGHVRIQVEIENTSGEPKTLKYKAATSPYLSSVVNQYVPFEYRMRLEFPTDRWSQVSGAGVRVASESSKEIATSSGLLSPPLTDATQTINFEARSDDVLLPKMQVYASPGVPESFLDSMQEQYEALAALYGGIGSVSKNMDAIRDGVMQMVDGAETMLEGVGERDEETGDGVVVKDDKGKTTTLLGGLQSSEDAYSDDLIPGADAALDGIDQMIAALEGPAADLTGGLEEITSGIGLLLSSLQTDDFTNPGFKEGMELVSGGLAALLDGLQSNDLGDPGFREGLQLLLAGLGDIANPPDTVTVIGTLETLLAGLGDIANPPDTVTIIGTLETLLAGLGSTANPPDTVTIIGTLETLEASADAAAAAAAAGLPPFLAVDPVAAAVLGSLADGIGDLLASIQTNDPNTPGFREGFLGLLGSLQTNDPNTPGFREGFLGLLGSLQTNDPNNPGFREGLLGLLAGLGDVNDPPDDTTVIGAIQLMIGGMDQLLEGLGETGAAEPDAETIIGALELLYGGLLQATPGSQELVDGILGGLGALRVGFSSPTWNQAQDVLDGKTPKEYYQECPGCFDPEFKAFDPATAGFSPGFRDVFVLFKEGLDAALKELHTFDDADPGLVDGLEQLRGALQQVGQGLFALDELGVRTIGGTVGDKADNVARDRAALADKTRDVGDDSVLGSLVDTASATYVFELPAQRTAAQDNVARGALLAVVIAAMSVLAHRMRRLDIS